MSEHKVKYPSLRAQCRRSALRPDHFTAALNAIFSNSESREIWGRLHRTETVLAINAKHKDTHDLKCHVFRSCGGHLSAPDKSCAGATTGAQPPAPSADPSDRHRLSAVGENTDARGPR